MLKTIRKKITIAALILALSLILTIPSVALASTEEWSMTVSDLSDKTVSVTYDQLQSMPKTTINAELRCYGNLVADGDWTGLKITDLLDALNINYSSVNSVSFLASDNYAVSIPMDYALRSDVIIAYQRNGALLPEMLRLVIPDSNGEAWISSIVFMGVSSNTVPDPVATTIKLPSSASDPGSLSSNLNGATNQAKSQSSSEPTFTPTPTPTNTSIFAPEEPPMSPTPTLKAAGEQAALFPVELVFAAILCVAFAVAALSLAFYGRRRTLN